MPALAHKTNFAVGRSDDWLPISEAARMMGIALRTMRWRCQSEYASKNLAQQRTNPTGKSKPTWWVHRSIDDLLSRIPDRTTRDARVRESLLAKFPAAQVERAYKKNHWLQKWRSRCYQPGGLTDRQIAAEIVDDAKRAEGDEFKIAVRSLQVWWNRYLTIASDGHISGVRGLVDRYVETQDADSGGRSPEAVAYFYELYHTESKINATICHELTRKEAIKNNWRWPKTIGATHKWLAKSDDRSMTCLLREGKDVWCRKYMHHLEIDYTLIEPGQFYQTDHHQCDFWVEHDGSQIRPWLTVIQDSRSRMIVGWHLGSSPHQDAIIAAYLMAFKNYAIPEKIRIDNGKDFASELLCGETKAARDRLRRLYGADYRRVMTKAENLVECRDPRFQGIVAELGVELVYAIPYAPWSKGITERYFRTFEERCGKSFATYCGNNTLTRPECLDVIRNGYTKQQRKYYKKKYGRGWSKVWILKTVDTAAVPTMDQAREAIGEHLDIYHATPHTADDMNHRNPLAVWNTKTRVRLANEDELILLMQSRGLYKVTANGVSLKIGGTRLTYGARCSALHRLIGRKVLITIDVNDLSYCCAYTAERVGRRLIGRLDANQRISPMATVDELRDANASVGKRRKTMHKAHRESAKRTRNVAAELSAKRREHAAELRKTGTDAADHQPNIVPVQTGFESVSRLARPTYELEPVNTDGFDEFFDDEDETSIDNIPLNDSMDDLFDEEQTEVREDNSITDLL